jgi:hypothetical protein
LFNGLVFVAIFYRQAILQLILHSEIHSKALGQRHHYPSFPLCLCAEINFAVCHLSGERKIHHKDTGDKEKNCMHIPASGIKKTSAVQQRLLYIIRASGRYSTFPPIT